MVREGASSGQLPGGLGSRGVGRRGITEPEPRIVQWPSPPPSRPGQPNPPSAPDPASEPRAPRPARYCYLLDADADLADTFDLRTRLVVRQVATARVLDVPAGGDFIEDGAGVGYRGLGALVLDGLFAVDVHVGGRTATELLGSGDLLQPPRRGLDELLDRELTRRALVEARVAVLDGEFLNRVRPWPEIVLALLRRCDKRALDLNLQRAVSSHPSLELRLALLLWHLAERWGRVEPCGIRLELPLTHALLGRLVAAERPSVSRSLGKLAEHGLVSGGAGDWHLAGSAEECLNTLGVRSVASLRPHHGVDGSASHAT